MMTVSRLRASVAWLTCVAALLIVPAPPVRGQGSDRRIILVNVLDQDGNQVSGLNAMNFRGEYQGQPVEVVSAAPDSAPRRIVVAMSGGFSGRKLGDATCVFTDGEDTVDSRDRKAVVTAVARTGVRVFVVRTPPVRPSAREHSQFQTATDWTESIAEATGGAASWLGDSHGLRTSSAMMAEAYRLELAFPRLVDEAREWRLEVVGPDGKALPNVRLVYPHLVAADAVVG